MKRNDASPMNANENRVDVWHVADAVLAVWLAGYAFVVVTSEALSLFGAFRPRCIQLVWLAAALVMGGGAWFRRECVRRTVVGLWRAMRFPTTFTGWCIGATAALTLVNAVLAPSDEQDALVYHQIGRASCRERV